MLVRARPLRGSLSRSQPWTPCSTGSTYRARQRPAQFHQRFAHGEAVAVALPLHPVAAVVGGQSPPGSGTCRAQKPPNECGVRGVAVRSSEGVVGVGSPADEREYAGDFQRVQAVARTQPGDAFVEQPVAHGGRLGARRALSSSDGVTAADVVVPRREGLRVAQVQHGGRQPQPGAGQRVGVPEGGEDLDTGRPPPTVGRPTASALRRISANRAVPARSPRGRRRRGRCRDACRRVPPGRPPVLPGRGPAPARARGGVRASWSGRSSRRIAAMTESSVGVCPHKSRPRIVPTSVRKWSTCTASSPAARA